MNKKKDRLRIGMLGRGPVSQAARFDACRKARNAELYAICDHAPDLLAAMTAIHSPQVVYDDYAAMLADPQVDAVIIATRMLFTQRWRAKRWQRAYMYWSKNR
jgi:predicted dehydrogenase